MWFSRKNVYSRRTQSSQASSSKGTQTIDSITFPKSLRLRKRQEFRHVLSAKNRFFGEVILIGYAPSTVARLGITVSRSFGKAVQRNRFKRIVREAFRKAFHQLPPYDLVIQPKTSQPISFENTLKDLSHFAHVLEQAAAKSR